MIPSIFPGERNGRGLGFYKGCSEEQENSREMFFSRSQLYREFRLRGIQVGAKVRKKETGQVERLLRNHIFSLVQTWNFLAYSFPTRKIPIQNAFVPISNAAIRMAESFTPSFMKGMKKIIPQKTHVSRIRLIPIIRCTLLFHIAVEISKSR